MCIEHFKDTYGSISDLVTAIAAVVGVIGAIIAFIADHERRKKQATIEFYHLIEREFVDALDIIEKKFPQNEVINERDIKHNAPLLNAITMYLSYMEDLAVGINTKVYDIHVFDRLAGACTIDWFDKLRVVIAHFRHEFDSRGQHKPYLYGDFEKMVLNLKKERNKRFPVAEHDLAKMKYDFDKNR